MSTQPHLNPEPQDAFSRRLTRALETPRGFTIPPDFAARVAAAAVELPTPAAARPRPPFTLVAIRVAFAILGLAMVALAARTRTAPNQQQLLLLGTEIALTLEFVVLATWLSLRPPIDR